MYYSRAYLEVQMVEGMVEVADDIFKDTEAMVLIKGKEATV